MGFDVPPTDDFALVIFDCDGVLVDSERIANTVFARVLREECGLNFDLDGMYANFVGYSSAQCMQIVAGMLGREAPAALQERYHREINAALRESVTAVRGVEQALAELTVPYCVASSGSYEKMRTTLGKVGLLDRMEGKLFSTADVARGKPFGDIYLHAARQMGGVEPGRCLVIEDSPTGVRGGVAARMVVFGYAELMGEARLRAAGAHRVFSDMARLADEMAAYSASDAKGLQE